MEAEAKIAVVEMKDVDDYETPPKSQKRKGNGAKKARGKSEDRSPTNAIKRHPHAGVPKIKWTDAELERLAAYRAEDPPLTYDEIAEREGGQRTKRAYSQQARKQARKNRKIIRHPRRGVPQLKWTAAELKRLAAYRGEDPPLTYDEIAEREGGRRTRTAYSQQTVIQARKNGKTLKRGFNNSERVKELNKSKRDVDAPIEEGLLAEGAGHDEGMADENTSMTDEDEDSLFGYIEDSDLAEELDTTRSHGDDQGE
ncbi:uncharacterized protein AB675_10318 [Cyphellophora attinorum]|uniref:Uncharacterized protein n=1 Tax=Cyphellophora attinorum TaxID=1664694 RepID=A0A0N1H760_9EURO|nr:uncharacterized protein AB675_10318 [Phialophora attinorum]KPI37375.1 hypothetical protein AB675_10318 [Phialophora attinorum]